VSNAKSFSHLDLKLSLPSHERVVAGRKFYLQLRTRFKLEHAICALATIRSEMLAPIYSSESQIGADYNFGAPQDVSQEDSDVDEREKLRRSRISRTNKGNIPWNKGKKHSPGWFTPIVTKEKNYSCLLNCNFEETVVFLWHSRYQLYLHQYLITQN
jgi:NUMOD3 motif